MTALQVVCDAARAWAEEIVQREHSDAAIQRSEEILAAIEQVAKMIAESER